MTTLRVDLSPASTAKADALVIAVAKGPKGKVSVLDGGAELNKALGGKLAAVLADLGATGAAGEVVRFSTFGATKAATVVATGVGEVKGSVDAEALRRAVGTAVRSLEGTSSVAVAVPVDGGLLAAAAEGALLSAYSFTDFRHSSLADRKAPVSSVTLLLPAGTSEADRRAAAAAVKRTQVVAAGVHFVRDMVNTPPSHLYPSRLAEIAADKAKSAGLTVEVLDEKALKKGGYGGILGVGQGSTKPPRLIRLGYTHPKAKTSVALVGKGITFDSGGLSIKPAQAMETMKMDMAGAATVIATISAVAALKLPINVTAWAPCAENMPSGTAIRPSDVLSTYSGKKVEVLNTDAEGRLILCDAISRACEEQPDVVIDIATLTGAIVVALGTRTAGVMANDDALRTALVETAGRVGESMWPMPLPPELRPSIDSEIADLQNIGDRQGGALVAGLFLKEFVPEGIAWAHVDIAGSAYNEGKPYGYTPTGGTGTALRTFVSYLEDLSTR